MNNPFPRPTSGTAATFGISALALLAATFSVGVPRSLALGETSSPGQAPTILQMDTRYSRVGIDQKGYIVSLTSLQPAKEYSPAAHPSPLLSLHENGQPYSELVLPTAATYDSARHEIVLKYPNGATAVVKPASKDKYLRFQLVSLTPRGDVDNVIWGPLHTTISKKIGDIIGVVRSDDWAIGMLGLDDNTIAGPPVDGDCYGMQYYIHSPDPVKCPVPSQYHEGQIFGIGGDGVNDVAFYSHPEEYFQQAFGTGAMLEPDFGSSVAYHSRDRRRAYAYTYSLLPHFHNYRPRHIMSDPLPGVDFIGSAVAVYSCPDSLGLNTIESIILAEGLPHPMVDGRWVRDSSGFQPDLFWNGPVDKEIEYAKAMGLKHLSRDGGNFFFNKNSEWKGSVGFSDGHQMSYKDFAAEAARHGMDHGGLHTLTLFLQGGISNDVTPVPSAHLQTVCRTKLAKDISDKDTEIEVVDPSFLADKGTWAWGDDSNYLVVGGETMRYSGVSETAPYIVKITERGHASKALSHKTGDELVKLQQNCYNGFVPDMTLMPEYADFIAKTMADNGMTNITFDGFESTIEMTQGYYGVRSFLRRFYDSYAKLTGGKTPRILPSCVFTGAWEYFQDCNVGGGPNMFDPVGNKWGTEGKDMRDGFTNSYFPGSFGIQGYHSEWSLYDAENLEAKSIGWMCTFALSTSQEAIERGGEKDGILKAFHTWEAARASSAFTPAQLKQLQDTNLKFHLDQIGEKSFALFPIKEIRIHESAGSDAKELTITNPEAQQPLQFALQVDGNVNECTITLPNGLQIKATSKMERGQFIICKGSHAYVADKYRKKLADLPVLTTATLPAGDSKLGVQLQADGGAKQHFNLTVWVAGKGEKVGI